MFTDNSLYENLQYWTISTQKSGYEQTSTMKWHNADVQEATEQSVRNISCLATQLHYKLQGCIDYFMRHDVFYFNVSLTATLPYISVELHVACSQP